MPVFPAMAGSTNRIAVQVSPGIKQEHISKDNQSKNK
jgi:hypothetical protein